MSDSEKKALVKVLRSLINSRQDGNIRYLSSDYLETAGCDIPYQRFGYRSLESFLLATGEFVVWPNQTIVAKVSEASEHIQKLVAEQNANKKKRRVVPQRIVPSKRHVSKPFTMQQSVYSNAYAQMKYRSPVKPFQRQSSYSQYNQLLSKVTPNYQKGNYNDRATQLTRTGQAPLHNDRPQYVFTFEGGMQPINALAAMQAKSPPIVKTHSNATLNLQEPIPSHICAINQTESVQTAPEKDLRHALHDRNNAQSENDLRQKVLERKRDKLQSVPIEGDLRKVLVERSRAVQTQALAQMAKTIEQSIHTRIAATVGPSRLQDRMKQNNPIKELVTSQPSLPEPKLNSRFKRFNSVPSQRQVSNGSGPVPHTLQPSSQSSAIRSTQSKQGNNIDWVKDLANFCENLKYPPPEYKLFCISKTARVKGNVRVNTFSLFW